MSGDTLQKLELKIETLEQLIKKVKNELSINKQLLQKAVREEAIPSISIGELSAITDDEISENPQLILEHATGTKRGYLSQLVEEVLVEIPTASEIKTGVVRYATEDEIDDRSSDGVVRASLLPTVPQASESAAGTVRMATSEEINSRSGAGVVRAATLPSGFDRGQKWSRYNYILPGRTDINSRDYPIAISITALMGEGVEVGLVVYVDDVEVARLFSQTRESQPNVFFIVPPRSKYKFVEIAGFKNDAIFNCAILS